MGFRVENAVGMAVAASDGSQGNETSISRLGTIDQARRSATGDRRVPGERVDQVVGIEVPSDVGCDFVKEHTTKSSLGRIGRVVSRVCREGEVRHFTTEDDLAVLGHVEHADRDARPSLEQRRSLIQSKP